MYFCVNVGNTSVQYGLFEGSVLRAHERSPFADLTVERLRAFVGDAPTTHAVVASVAPSRTEAVCDAVRSATGCSPIVVGDDVPVPIEVRLDEPGKVGVDRLLNALAAFRRTGTQTIVVDIGTAVTVDVVSASGALCGGAIAPGPSLMIRAMQEGAEMLPDVSFEPPHFVVGRDTREAMLSGAFWGTVGAVERLIRQVRGELIGEMKVLATGGAARRVAPYLPEVDAVVPELTLAGLRITAEQGESRKA